MAFLMVTAGNPRIDDSSLIVPLSDTTHIAVLLKIDIVEEPERFHELHRGAGMDTERIHAFASAGMG